MRNTVPLQSLPASAPWPKAISPARDRRQSRALVVTLGLLLVAAPVLRAQESLHYHPLAVPALLVSAVFALVVWRLRAATPAAALAGCVICLQLCTAVSRRSDRWLGSAWLPAPAGLLALLTLFVLTFLATRFGRRQKRQLGLAESRRGRQASQILANLGIAALAATAGLYPSALAALAEAAADTISSEVGQALGGPTVLLSTLRPVPPGTDGGLSVRGTLAGLAAALAVVAAGLPRHHSFPIAAVALPAACLGLFVDSLLGATVERRGWLGNDLVNVSSTLVAALAALAFERI